MLSEASASEVSSANSKTAMSLTMNCFNVSVKDESRFTHCVFVRSGTTTVSMSAFFFVTRRAAASLCSAMFSRNTAGTLGS